MSATARRMSRRAAVRPSNTDPTGELNEAQLASYLGRLHWSGRKLVFGSGATTNEKMMRIFRL